MTAVLPAGDVLRRERHISFDDNQIKYFSISCPFNSPLIHTLYFSYSTSSTDWRAKYNEVNSLVITI
jgi:hypothetical protein